MVDDEQHTLRLVSKKFRKAVDFETTTLRWEREYGVCDDDVLRYNEFPKLRALHIKIPEQIYLFDLDANISTFHTHLQILEFSRLVFVEHTATTLSSVTWTALEDVNFSNCAFFDTPSGFISQCPRLHTLRMTNIREPVDEVYGILNTVLARDMPCLEVLDISQNTSQWNLGTLICTREYHWPSLKMLDMVDCFAGYIPEHDLDPDLDPHPLRALCTARLPQLEQLRLGHDFGEVPLEYVYVALRRAMETNWIHLKELDLREHAFEDDALPTLLDTDVPFNALCEINTPGGVMGPRGLLALANAGAQGRLPAYETIEMYICDKNEDEVLKVLEVTWPRVRTLILYAEDGFESDAERIASLIAGNFPALQDVSLTTGFEAVLRSGYQFTGVEKVTFNFKNGFPDDVYRYGPRCFPNLLSLSFPGCSLTLSEFQKMYHAPWQKLERIECSIRDVIHRSHVPCLL
jgi:hypothetical protein